MTTPTFSLSANMPVHLCFEYTKPGDAQPTTTFLCAFALDDGTYALSGTADLASAHRFALVLATDVGSTDVVALGADGTSLDYHLINTSVPPSSSSPVTLARDPLQQWCVFLDGSVSSATVRLVGIDQLDHSTVVDPLTQFAIAFDDGTALQNVNYVKQPCFPSLFSVGSQVPFGFRFVPAGVFPCRPLGAPCDAGQVLSRFDDPAAWATSGAQLTYTTADGRVVVPYNNFRDCLASSPSSAAPAAYGRRRSDACGCDDPPLWFALLFPMSIVFLYCVTLGMLARER